MKGVIRRETVALVLLPALYLYIMKLSEGYFFALLVAIVVVALAEFCGFYKAPSLLTIEVAFFSGLYLYSVYKGQNLLLHIILTMTLALMVSRLFFLKRGPSGALKDLAPVFVGFFYITFLSQFALLIRAKGPEWILYLFATVWGADSLAYYLGKTFGRRKLYPAVSPKKTVEGAFGSILGGVLASVVMKYLLVDISMESAILGGLSLGFGSMLGDLTESMFKRDAGVKDSSTIVPAHGGILDKIDGVLFCCPVVYFLFCA